ncbi:hypothetical protein PybrP1_005714 [[Pythium] brassicae (nom. inval.)]|nr:hypothetical protein PybrP1_005714 [[Pythium] brassicae (nom. inval.)]
MEAALSSRENGTPTETSESGRGKLFLTEVDGTPLVPRTSRWGAVASAVQRSSKDGGGEVRESELASRMSSGGDGGAEVFRVIDSMSEKQQRSRTIRSMIQKAAQKTILVVRAKNATQAAENVTIRFNTNRVTDTPRAVQLRSVCKKVLRHTRYGSKKQQQQFREIFADAAEVDALLKDMFWYLTAHCFQRDQHPQLEQSLYARIADNFTALFIRLQMQPASRDSGFFDVLPDVVAQILFVALYEAFPKSRKHMLTNEMRREILHLCHCWILGFVPADLSWAHWIAVDQESPKRIAALADFPAMRNRMLRAERIERTKLDVKNRRGASLVDDAALDESDDDELDPEATRAAAADTLPPLAARGAAAGGGGGSARIQTRERCVYQMRNSPLVDAFLKRHQLEANAAHLTVQLRLTSGTHFDLKTQEALHETRLPRGRRRRVIDPKAYAAVLHEIESFGDSVRRTYASEKKKAQDRDAAERKRVLAAQRELEAQLGALATCS